MTRPQTSTSSLPTHAAGVATHAENATASARDSHTAARKPLLRESLGRSLKVRRTDAGQSLRDVSAVAQISPGYLSELERGRKEASSELLASVCAALGTSVADVLIDAAVDMQAGSALRDYAAQRLQPLAILTPDSHAGPRAENSSLHAPR